MPTPAPIGDHASAHASIRVYCNAHRLCLYAGSTEPEGGAEGVWKRAGCPPFGADQEAIDACPNWPPAPKDLHGE